MASVVNHRIQFFKFGLVIVFACVALYWFGQTTGAQMIDKTRNPNAAGSGIAKSFTQQIGAGQGNWTMPDSSSFIIHRDPFRAIRRGRQLFQRKFLRPEGQGPIAGDSIGNIHDNLQFGAGMSDSCASCHGRPRGSAGFGGDVVTRPDSRDAPHLFGLGLKEMLADEITTDLRAIKASAAAEAVQQNRTITKNLISKGLNYGKITALPNGTFNTSEVLGVDADLRVRPFFHHGGTISIHEFIVGALNNEMGLQAVDPQLLAAHNGARITTESGMVLDGSLDQIEGPHVDDAFDDQDNDGITNEVPSSIVDHLEFYLLNYFKPGQYEQTAQTSKGRDQFTAIGCAKCHVPDLRIERDRRVADVETVYDRQRGIFNSLFSTAQPLFTSVSDSNVFPSWKKPNGSSFLVRNIFTDFKRHDIGAGFYEKNYDGTMRTMFMTEPLWGVGSTAPYGHEGRSINLAEVILRHGGEALDSRNAFAALNTAKQQDLIAFLNSLIIFPPDDTASNLDPGNIGAVGFPQNGHGSIKLTVLFNDPNDVE